MSGLPFTVNFAVGWMCRRQATVNSNYRWSSAKALEMQASVLGN